MTTKCSRVSRTGIPVVLVCLSLTCAPVLAGSHSGWVIATVNTLSSGSANILGRVTSLGSPVADACVEVEGIGVRARTAADGTFVLSGVPYGTGYAVVVSKQGYVGRRRTGIIVWAIDVTLPDFALDPYVPGDYRIVDLVPSPNPPCSTIEEGGRAFRYYQVLASDGRIAQDVPITVRIGDTVVPQETQLLELDGLRAGRSDHRGYLLVEVPAAYLTDNLTTVSLYFGENPKKSFSVQRLPSQKDHIWSQETGGGVGIQVKFAKPGLAGAVESEIVHALEDTVVTAERVSRKRVFGLSGELGAGLGPGIEPIGDGLWIGATGNIGLRQEFEFSAVKSCVFGPSGVSTAEAAAMKLYLVYGDVFAAGASLVPFAGFINLVRDAYEPIWLGAYVDSMECNTRSTSGPSGEIVVGILDEQAKNLAIGGAAGAKGDSSILWGTELTPRDTDYRSSQSWAHRTGFETKAAAEILYKDDSLFKFSIPFLNNADEMECRATFTRPRLGSHGKAAFSIRNTIRRNDSFIGSSWGELLDGATLTWANAVETEMLMTCEDVRLADLTDYAEHWRYVAEGSVLMPAPAVSGENERRLQEGLATYASHNNKRLTYTRSVQVEKRTSAQTGLDLSAIAAGLSLSDVGFAWVNACRREVERGVYWYDAMLPLERYPPIAESDVPVKTMAQFTLEWAPTAAWYIGEGAARFMAGLADAGQDTIIRTMDGILNGVNGTLTIFSGAMAQGSQIVCESLPLRAQPSGSTALHAQSLPEQRALQPLDDSSSSSNYTYGVGGVLRFSTTNTFSGTGLVSIAYTDDDIEGLDESALRMYRLGEENAAWHYLGGWVDADSNTVSCIVTQLGTFAVAPPMPNGVPDMSLSVSHLVADGISSATVSVAGIQLNTGANADGAWLFDVAAQNVDVLTSDADPDRPGLQVLSDTGAFDVTIRSLPDSTDGILAIQSVQGTAGASLVIPVSDDAPPAAPSNVTVVAGQSRLWVSWDPNTEADLAGYRVYYNQGAAGPPYEGAAAVEGRNSPVDVLAAACLLRGLDLNQTYFLAVTALDGRGNESPPTTLDPVTTVEGPPTPPGNVTFVHDTNDVSRLTWTLSEDDGYNDRDVVGYEMYRTVHPAGVTQHVATLPPGTIVFEEPFPEHAEGEFVSYSIVAVDTNAVASERAVSTHPHADGGTDNDFDGMQDQWELLHDLDPFDPTDAGIDTDGDGLSNLEEYLLGTNPRLRDTDGDGMSDGDEVRAGTDPLSATDVFKVVTADGEEAYLFVVTWTAKAGRTYRVETTDDLGSEWVSAPDGAEPEERNERTATQDGVLRYLDSSPGPVENRFYRVEVLP